MSVAFRREGDEEHKEPRFELPLPAGPNLVTARGLALTRAKVDELEAAAREGAPEETLRELRYWRTRLATAELVPAASGEEAAFGTRVTIRLAGRTRTLEIVGDDEAEPAADRIAFTAPLARAVMGLAAGECADFAGKADAIEVVRVEVI